MISLLLLTIIVATATTSMAAPTSTNDDRWCLKSCEGRMDGNYPSCKGIRFYSTCSGGVMYDRPCAPGTQWDNWNKICNHIPASDITTSICVKSCHGRPDGNYQSCHGCHVFASCTNGRLIDNRPCPDNNLVWDDRRKDCVYKSSTCPETNRTSGSPSNFVATIGNYRCVSSCYGMPDGDYQSCKGCHYYLTCSNGRMYDRRACPGRLVWDDIIKRCSWGSRTCQDRHPIQSDRCVDDCVNVEDGDYQSCLGCKVYATCSNGIIADNRPCPSGLLWDDNKRECSRASITCNISTITSTTTAGTTTSAIHTTLPVATNNSTTRATSTTAPTPVESD